MNAFTATRTRTVPSGRGPSGSRHGRTLSAAGAAYVGSWVVGLLLAPASPAGTAPASEVHAFYADHGAAILVQSGLVHGLAGVALAVMALTIPAATGTRDRLAISIRTAGVAAAVVSLVQVALAGIAVATASSVSAATSDAVFDALNHADTGKLALLAVFAGSVTVAGRRAGMLRGWMRPLASALVVALPLGGLAFVVPNAALTAVLYLSLPLLLVWAGAVAWQVGRGPSARA